MSTLEKRGDLFILTITGDDQHRLRPALIDSIRASLHQAKSEFESTRRPSALITTAQGKFFSNGYDLSWALSDPDPDRAQTRFQSMSKKLRLLVEDLISLPMPTIAAVTGHASAAGFFLALAHDYLLMRKDRGFLYMSELDINLQIPHCFMLLLKHKIASPKIWRDVVLKAAKITAATALEWGIVDSAHDGGAATVDAATELGRELVARKWVGKSYSDNRRTMFADVLAALSSDETVGDNGDDSESKVVSRL